MELTKFESLSLLEDLRKTTDRQSWVLSHGGALAEDTEKADDVPRRSLCLKILEVSITQLRYGLLSCDMSRELRVLHLLEEHNLELRRPHRGGMRDSEIYIHG